MDPNRKITKKFTKKFGSKVINRQYFHRKTGLKSVNCSQFYRNIGYLIHFGKTSGNRRHPMGKGILGILFTCVVDTIIARCLNFRWIISGPLQIDIAQRSPRIVDNNDH